MRAIRAIGYDMDYTLVHYHVEPWERRAYQHLRGKLADLGLPAADLEFDPALVTRGLIIDAELGNLVKANRFGYVTRACHGTVPIEFERQRAVYGRTLVYLSEARYAFLNTLFSLSEACMYAQLVDRLDERGVSGALGYADLHRLVRRGIDEAHLEGELKADITAAPDTLHRGRLGAGPRPARPARGGQAPDDHHQLRLGVHRPHDDPRARPVPPGRAWAGATSSSW